VSPQKSWKVAGNPFAVCVIEDEEATGWDGVLVSTGTTGITEPLLPEGLVPDGFTVETFELEDIIRLLEETFREELAFEDEAFDEEGSEEEDKELELILLLEIISSLVVVSEWDEVDESTASVYLLRYEQLVNDITSIYVTVTNKKYFNIFIISPKSFLESDIIQLNTYIISYFARYSIKMSYIYMLMQSENK
jgi:hypothetical protein